MASTIAGATHLDNFFATSAARLDRWRELNARAQVWAAEARGGNPRGGRAAVEAAQ
jgi:arginine decarboxylase